MKTKLLLTKMLLAVAGLCAGSMSAWATDVPYTVGTTGTGDEWSSRKYSDAYEIALGETYHFTFTNTSYGANNWNNWLLDCKATSDTNVDDWYFTMRSDNYGWGTSYNSTMRSADFVWDDFKTVMNGATVDMYINYNATDKIIRTYATITSSDAATTWHYNFASKAIEASSVFLLLSEELAVLNLTTAEKVASIPDGTYTIYQRSITSGYGYTWDTNTEGTDYTGWSVETSGTKTLDLTDGLKTVIGNSTGSLKTTITPTIGNIITVDANFSLYGVATSTNVSYFRFGNIYIVNDGVECQSRYLLNGNYSTENTGTLFHSTTKGSTSIYRKGNIPYHLQLEINTLTNKVTSMKVYVNGELEPSLNLSNQSLSNYEYTSIEFGYIKYGRSNNDSNGKLTEITITETPQVISTVNYTVKFQDALGNTLKSDVVHDNGVVGEIFSATLEDLATFYNNVDESLATAKYIYKSGDNTSIIASSTAASNVITLVFDVYDKTAYTVNAQASGSDIKTGVVSGSAFLDGSTTVYWSKYLKVGEQWYVADDDTYGSAITAATTNVAYTATDAIDNFFEYESMSESGTMVDGVSGASISGGSSQRFGANGKKWTSVLAGGIYTVNLYCCGNNGKTPTLPMYYCDADGSNVAYIGEATACNATTWDLKSTTNVIIPDGKALCFFNNSSSTHNYQVDYVTVKRTGDFASASVSKTITAAGWATYCSPYALDLEHATGLTDAYIVTGGDGSVLAKTSVKGGTVPANTGLLLKGDAGIATIPVVANSSTDVSANKLVGKTESYVLAANGGYVLMASPKVGFYSNNKTFTVGANTAYLPAGFDGTGAPVFYLFDNIGGTTGIDTVNGSEFTVNGEYYNVAGQRVAQPTKGLYIVNGKKVVVK